MYIFQAVYTEATDYLLVKVRNQYGAWREKLEPTGPPEIEVADFYIYDPDGI